MVSYNQGKRKENKTMMYKVMMYVEGEWYEYGEWADRNKANEVAMEVRDERGCWVRVDEVE